MFNLERDETTVELDQFVPYPPSIAWRTLTEPDLISRWFTRSAGFSLTVGSTFILELPANPPAEVACQVLDVLPHHRFTHSYTDLRGSPPARWVVDWRLTPHGRGTRILLEHRGFDVEDHRQRMARNAAERAWRTRILPRLAQVVAEVGQPEMDRPELD